MIEKTLGSFANYEAANNQKKNERLCARSTAIIIVIFAMAVVETESETANIKAGTGMPGKYQQCVNETTYSGLLLLRIKQTFSRLLSICDA
mmetsp:Transcript_26043/g.60466  ORF Transcript_26043/g.60466 Transcript_26043/m.60466 type:complete len:91 (+) Transcript_26043:2190-2462(+)